MHTSSIVLRRSVSVVGLLALAACSGGGSSGSSSGVVSGTIEFVPVSMLTGEIEPNDSVDEAQPIGALAADRAVRIGGTIGAGEGFDAFAFTAPERVLVEARLARGSDASAVRIGAFDPVSMSTVATSGDDGVLRFVARGAFDVVMRSGASTTSYELVVTARRLSVPISRGGHVGSLAIGETLAFAPTGRSRFEATSVEAQTMTLSVRGAGGVRVVDDASGSLLAELRDGSRSVDLAPLQRVSIESDGACAIDVSSAERAAAPAGSSPPVPLVAAPARFAAESVERATWSLAPDEAPLPRATWNARRGEFLVKPRAGADLSADLAHRGLVERARIDGGAALVTFDLAPSLSERERDLTTRALVASLAASPRVEYAELNLVRTAQGTPLPNDTHFHLQWHYTQIHLPEAWAAAGGFSASLPQVVVAVIDTGERAHEDLDANLLPGFDFITDPAVALDGNGVDGNPHDEGDSDGVAPSSFHGTHVAGTIAAVTNNALGVAGIGISTKVRHLRVLGKGGGTDFDIARAVRYAAGLAQSGLPTLATKCDVINMSLGSTGSSTTLRDACAAAHDAGVVIFAAAGNNNSSVPFFPASYPKVISVSAVDINSQRAPYSNFNSSVDLCAPGGDTSENTNGDPYPDGVLSTLVDQQTSASVYVFYQGTSMASPHAAGLAALMKSVNTALTPDDIEARMKASCIDLGAPGQDVDFGVGLVDALGCVQQALGTTSGTPVLTVTPLALAFGDSDTQIDLALANGGVGTVHVVDAVEVVDQPWLTVSTVASASSSIDVSRVHAAVDRSGLAAGDYTATVRITWNDGATAHQVDVPVTMTVDTATLPSAELFLLAVQEVEGELHTVAQAVIDPSMSLQYALDAATTQDGHPLPPGDYLIVCGSDDGPDTDGDGFPGDGVICGEDDVYCGAYPTIDDPTFVHVDGNVDGIDFVVAPTASTTALVHAPRRGFALLRRR